MTTLARPAAFRIPWGWILALTLGLALSCSAEVAFAQEPTDQSVHADSVRIATLDSLFAKIDSVLASSKAAPTIYTAEVYASRVENRMATEGYAGGIAVALVANTVLHIDRDPCPTGKRVCFSTDYRDRWLATDKFNHANVAYVLTSTAMKMGVPPAWAFALTCGVAGPGIELTQGYVSLKDIGADCLGSGLSLGLHYLGRKASDEGWFHLHR